MGDMFLNAEGGNYKYGKEIQNKPCKGIGIDLEVLVQLVIFNRQWTDRQKEKGREKTERMNMYTHILEVQNTFSYIIR